MASWRSGVSILWSLWHAHRPVAMGVVVPRVANRARRCRLSWSQQTRRGGFTGSWARCGSRWHRGLEVQRMAIKGKRLEELALRRLVPENSRWPPLNNATVVSFLL
jgi:hypothetical protein